MKIADPKPLDISVNRTLLRRGEFFPATQATIERFRISLEWHGTALLIAGDIIAWCLAFIGTVALFPGSAGHDFFLWITPILGTSAFALIGGYDKRNDFLRAGFVSEAIIAILSASAVSMFVAYVFSAYNLNVKPSRAFIPVLFGFFSFGAIYVRRVYGFYFRRQWGTRALLVIGGGAEARGFYRSFTESGLNWSLDFIDPAGATAGKRIDGKGSPLVESNAMARLDSAPNRYAVVLLACDPSQLPSSILLQLIRLHVSKVPVVTLEAFHELRWERVSIDALGPKWLFEREFRLAHNSIYSYFKRLLDILSAAFALMILSPAMLVIACLIRLDSAGPAIFRQQRVGRYGSIFTLFKFRTMRLSSDQDIYTRKGDRRVTSIGRWLRRYRLDELPQLWNVLTGSMSLIGPRAEWVKCAEMYEKEISLYHMRHLVLPGITGWAQVKFKYGENKKDAVAKFEYDLYYIRNFSVHLDATIVLKTIYTMICGKGQ